MCRLCYKIYQCTESSPYLSEHLHLDPEGNIQLILPWYDILSEVDGYVSMVVKYCPECGCGLYKRLNK